jgi:hypothetical protein
MPKREMRLVPTQPVVGRHHGDSALAGGTLGEAGRPRAPAASPPGALWGLSGAAQPPAWGDIPTPRQQGVEEQEDSTASPRWSWARLLKRVFAVDMARCPWCQRGVLRIIAAITQGEVIRQILRHLKLSVDPPPLAPARVHQEAFAWSSA